MADLSYVFAIFFLTLGPLKVVPAFAGLTHAMPRSERWTLALKSVLLASGIVLFVAFGAAALGQKWGISWASLAIATGLLLLISALKTLNAVFVPPPPAEHEAPTQARGLILSPVAVPMIVTPYGVGAILLFLAGHPGDDRFRLGVIALLALNMVLNLICMLFALTIARLVTPAGWKLLGWIFSILQAALAIEVMVAPARRLLNLPVAGA